MAGVLLNYNPYDGPTEIIIDYRKVILLADFYREVTGQLETKQDDVELIRSYQPSLTWYQGFKAMDRIDVRVYNYDLLAPGFDLLSFLQSHREGKLTHQIRSYLIETAEFDPQFDPSDPANFKDIQTIFYTAPLVLLLYKLTGQQPEIILRELAELSNLNHSNYALLAKYEEAFDLVIDLYQTMALEIPPLDSQIILFRSGQLSDSSFEVGSLNNISWRDPKDKNQIQSINQMIYVPAGSRILPYYEREKSDLKLRFLLPLGTQWKLIEHREMSLNHYWTFKSDYKSDKFFNQLKLVKNKTRPQLRVNIYRTIQSNLLEPYRSSFESILNYDLTTINYNRRSTNFQFPSRLSPGTTYTYDLKFWDPQFLTEYKRRELYQLEGNTADLLYQTKRFITQEEPVEAINQFSTNLLSSWRLLTRTRPEDLINQFLNRYLPSQAWLEQMSHYILNQEYRHFIIEAYNHTGDRLINGYLREQLTFRRFLLRYIDVDIPEDPVQKEKGFDLLRASSSTIIKMSEGMWLLLLKKLGLSSEEIESQLLEYLFFGSSRSPDLEIYDSLPYELSLDLQNFILEAPPLDQELIVYRGINHELYNLDCSSGGKFTMNGMISTSLTLQTATTFGCYLFIIRVPAGSRVLPINLPTIAFKEREILLPHGSTFVLDRCLDLPYLETIEFEDLAFYESQYQGNKLVKVCSKRPVRFYFCRLVDQPTMDSN